MDYCLVGNRKINEVDFAVVSCEWFGNCGQNTKKKPKAIVPKKRPAMSGPRFLVNSWQTNAAELILAISEE